MLGTSTLPRSTMPTKSQMKRLAAQTATLRPRGRPRKNAVPGAWQTTGGPGQWAPTGPQLEPANPVTEIEAALNDLQHGLACLAEDITALESRLKQVLIEVPVGDAGKTTAKGDCGTPIGRTIASCSQAVRFSSERLQSIMSRIGC